MNPSNSYFQGHGQWALEAKPLPMVQEDWLQEDWLSGLLLHFWLPV